MDFFIPEAPVAGIDRFGRKFKNWREWKNTKDFLENLDEYLDIEKLFCTREDPPDVVYEDLRFEVKEILDEGRKRHDEVKREIGKHGHTLPFVSNPDRIIFDLRPKDAADLVIKKLELYESKKAKYSPTLKCNIDILFYINKKHHFFADDDFPNTEIFAKFGWRSVSCVIGSNVSIIFHANANAPVFLQDRAGRYFEKS